MDEIFGINCYQNQITWLRSDPKNGKLKAVWPLYGHNPLLQQGEEVDFQPAVHTTV